MKKKKIRNKRLNFNNPFLRTPFEIVITDSVEDF